MKKYTLVGLFLLIVSTIQAQKSKPLTEDDFYELVTVPIPESIKLEVGGLAVLPDGRIGVSTRRGDIWVIENPYMTNQTRPHYTKFASGMHEVLGLAYKDGSFYCTQRGELTKVTDDDGDGKADRYEPIVKFPLSGNYHEYTYGPVFDKQGNMLVTLNLAWVGYGEGKMAKWRGWLLKISPDGKIVASGTTAPASVVRTWDVANGTMLQLFSAHGSGDVTSVRFSPDGQRLLTAGTDGILRISDVKAGDEIYKTPTQAAITAAVFTPRGRRAVFGMSDGTIKIWQLPR